MNFHFAIGMTAQAVELVERHHYSGRAPSNIQAVATLHENGGLFGDFGPAVAACIFTIPGTRWSAEVWELARLVRRPDTHPALSSLIGKAVQWIKRTGKIDLLVSFADWTQRHHGGIYQASGWQYAGQRDRRMDGLTVNGVFVPGRSCNSRWGTRSPSRLAEKIDADIQPHFDEGKHLYWKPLFRSGHKKAAILGLESLPYPKPNAARLSDALVPTGVSQEHTLGAAPFLTVTTATTES